jgi:dolichol-phosphate mannosyltransferase
MYNEEKSAAKCIDEVVKVLDIQPVRTKLLIIDDGSKDNTKTILLQKLKQYPGNIILVLNKKNKGYGGALQSGIKEGIKKRFQYALFMDSDLTNNPKYITAFVKEISNGYNCVKASRYIKGGKMIGIPIKRRFFSVLGSIIIRNFFRIGIKDCTNGFRMVQLNLLKDMQFKESNFSIILEELYYLKKRHATFKEIPTILTSRKDTKSHFAYTPSLLYDYAKYAWKALFI